MRNFLQSFILLNASISNIIFSFSMSLLTRDNLMLKRYFFIFFSLLLIPGVTHASYDWCHRKQAALKRQLDYAQRYGNVHRVNGLQYALERVESKCQYGYRGLNQGHMPYLGIDNNRRVLNKKMKVEEKRVDLEKAIAKGNHKEIIKKRGKLRQAELELKYYKELSESIPGVIED